MSTNLMALGALGTAAVLLQILLTTRRRGVRSLDGFFAIGQWLMLIGTLLLVEPENRQHVFYSELLTCFVVVFSITNGCASLALGGPVHRVRTILPITRKIRATTGILAGCVAITLLYFMLVGYSAFIEGLVGLLSGEQVDVATLRLESYSGSRYLAPGFFNQVRIALLPSLVVALIFSVRRRRGLLSARLWFAVLMPATLLALLGTAQRTPFVVWVLVGLSAANIAGVRIPASKFMTAAVASFVVFSLSTFVLGRSDENAFAQAWHRVARSNQIAGLSAFEYTADLPVAYGAEWGRSILGLIPGQRGSDLASRVFETLHNTTRGTSPPSLVGSIHHNFGTGGVPVFAAILGMATAAVSRLMFLSKELHVIELMGMAGVCAVGGAWIAGGPTYLANTGLATFSVLWWVGAKARRRVVMLGRNALEVPSMPQSDPRRRAVTRRAY